MAPPDLDSMEARYSLHLQTVGVDPRSIREELDGTVRSGEHRNPSWTPEVRALPTVSVAETTGEQGELAVVRLLGMGGMGKVVLALQRALDREVAIKLLRTPGDAAATELLREALVTGRLEHPNIVPVHQLAQASDGAPLFVMKRVEGTPFSQLLKDPLQYERLNRRAAEPLAAHLDVFLEVCNAVAFAHSRGVLHRDLKPDNVMVGAFGEVYVLDWGIAVSLTDDPHLPQARDVRSIAGTPAYMAPEMAGCAGSELSERTDVYLLGAMLHELLTGEPPHLGPTMLASLASAWEGKLKQYGPLVPQELADVARKAMALEPKHRFESVEALKRAVAAYLDHRDAWALAGEATRRLEALAELVHKEKAGEPTDAVTVQRTFIECRFGFEQARRRWAEFSAAADGLARAVALMVEHEVLRDNAAAARALLSELPSPPAPLVAQVEALEARQAQGKKRLATLEKLEREMDIDVGLLQRGRLAAVVAVGAGVAAFVVGFFQRRGDFVFSYPHALGFTAAFAVGIAVVARRLERTTVLNEAQRRLLRANLAALGCFTSFWLLAWWVNARFDAALVLFNFLVAALWLAAALLFDRRGLVVAAAFGLGAVASALWPGAQIEIFGAELLLGFLGLSLAWRQRDAAAGR